MLPLQRSIDEALMSYYANHTSLQYTPSYAQFTHPVTGTTDEVSRTGPTFFFGALMFNFVMQVGQIVAEREFLLRQGMEVSIKSL